MKKNQRRLSRPKKRATASSATRTSKPKHADGSTRKQSQSPEGQIQNLIDLLKQNNLTELEWEYKGFRVRLRDEGEPSSRVHVPNPRPAYEPQHIGSGDTSYASHVTDTAGMVTITSPIVGTFYRSPSPDADPYVEENDTVKKGQVLCIVEAMKLMNEIESEVDGRVVKILVDSTKPVEYGQPLFLIDPSSGN